MPLYNMYGGLESLKNTSSQFPLFAVVRFPALAAVSGGPEHQDAQRRVMAHPPNAIGLTRPLHESNATASR